TAERFALQPFRHEGFYRTGDLARRRADGMLEFIGRSDERVKIRGQRVELAEVESALRSHTDVDDAAVVVATGHHEMSRLVAYVVAKSGRTLDTRDLRAGLRGRLSDAAMPDLIVALEHLPRNAAGKIDRVALPLPQLVDDADANEHEQAHSGVANR